MALRLTDVDIRVGDKQLFYQFSLEVPKGTFCTLMGPSGCGKSTLFNFILGCLPQGSFTFSGKVSLQDRDLTSLPLEQRQIGILFQDPLLFPHLNVAENLAFGIRGHDSRAAKLKKIRHALSEARLPDLEKQSPDTLSGGEKTRISLLRTLLGEPQALLLDEPFSKLDKELRDDFRDLVFSSLRTRSIPVVLVTHDPNDIPQNCEQVIELHA